MQTWSGQNAGGAVSPTRKFITTVLIVFSLAGLIIGFAVGGLTHPPSSTVSTTGLTTKPKIVAQTTVAAIPTATPEPDVTLGLPQFTTYTPTESATGSTQYTVTMQAVDKKKKPVHSSDVTCKLWLVQQIPAGQKMSIDASALKNVNNLTTPIPATLNGQPVPELQYLAGITPAQLTKCNPNGQATWTYTIAPTAAPGSYELVLLADWKGVHYNYSWSDIVIK